MKKLLLLAASLFLVLSFTVSAGAKTVTIGLDADPVSLDPQVQLSHWIYDPLVRWTQELTFEPRLATKWERMDELTMRFYLRKGVKFHSGNPFTAKDVKWSFDRMRTGVDFKALLEPFEGVTIIDDYTVDIKTKKPYALLLNMATYFFCHGLKVLYRYRCKRTAQGHNFENW